MKKLLLLGALIGGSLLNANAQATCAAAEVITTNGTYTAFDVTGTYQALCYASVTNIKASWFKWQAPSNGHVLITSNLAQNDGVSASNDTRLSILKGTSCTTLECVESNDDISETNYRSEAYFPVQANAWYYFEWDNRWNVGTASAELGFDFNFTFTASTCVMPGSYDFYLPDSYTTTSAALYWDPAIGTPANYDIDWSTNFATAAGAGTIVTAPAGSLAYVTATVNNIPAGSNFRYYVRSNCGGSTSPWQGPYYGYLAKTLPYSNTFESTANNLTDGFVGSGWTPITTSASSTPANYADGGAGTALYTYNSTTAASNLWGYTRGFSLQQNEQVTLNFKTRLYPASSTVPMTVRVTVGNAQTTTAQTTTVQTITVNSGAAYTNQTVTWTAPAAGVYYFGFNNNSAAGATQAYLFMDTLSVTSVLGNEEFQASEMSVFPNPATNVINVSNPDALVNGVTITDLNGRTVKTVKLAGVSEAQISVSDLSAGMYLMNITSDKGAVTKKIVKQ